jgi:hypothetical protein
MRLPAYTKSTTLLCASTSAFATPLALKLFALGANLSLLLIYSAAPVVFLLVAIAFVAAAKLLATVLSRGLSTALDGTAWRQIRASAYGNDTQGEVAQSGAGSPTSIESRPQLPETLAAEINLVADTAAAASVSKLRASINRLAFAQDKGARSDLVSEYLTWDELIHTAYFKVPRFNKLVAYAIAHSESFQPTARFLGDPDYPCLAAWYAELTTPAEIVSKVPAP